MKKTTKDKQEEKKESVIDDREDAEENEVMVHGRKRYKY